MGQKLEKRVCVKTTQTENESNLRNLKGTFAVEGLSVSPNTRKKLECIASGQANCQQIIDEIIAKYKG